MDLTSELAASKDQVNQACPKNVRRHWLGKLDLVYQLKNTRSTLVHSAHLGPLRVQRPFYPEQDGCCHTYILHPPGGMAVGDRIEINAELGRAARSLFTTPSAGKMYGTLKVDQHQLMPQRQRITINVAEGAVAEWLPQETIVFDGAQARLDTEFHLQADAKLIAWDIVRLGRIASGETFSSGSCRQKLSVFQGGHLVFHELNPMQAASPLMTASWGLQGCTTLATMIATVSLDRDQLDALVDGLDSYRSDGGRWGLTQKEGLFIARYLGNNILDCRAGLEWLWSELRPVQQNKRAVIPRIWNT